MKEQDFALKLFKDLQEFKKETATQKNYVGCIQYLNINDLKDKNLDIDNFLDCCRKLGLKADYPQNLTECLEKEYKDKNLIALILN